MAGVSVKQRRKIIKIIQLALNPEIRFRKYAEVAKTQGNSGDKFPIDTIRMDCLLPLCYVADEVGKKWLYMRYENKNTLEEIAEEYHIKHRMVIKRRIEYVLNVTVDSMFSDQAAFILSVYREEYGLADPDTISDEIEMQRV